MIIFINGASNSGKSTLAHLLARKIQRSLVIEIDTLVNASRNSHPILRVQEAVTSGVALIHKYSLQGYSVIVPFPLSPEQHAFFCRNMKTLDKNVYFFTLSPSMETILIPRGSRLLTVKEQDRIRHFYRHLLHQPSFGIIIDNSNQLPQETADIMLNHIHRLQSDSSVDYHWRMV